MGIAHPQAKFIKAWANGEKVEWRYKAGNCGYDHGAGAWHVLTPSTTINWTCGSIEFRLPPKPYEYWADNNGVYTRPPLGYKHNLHLFFEEGKLVKAEVVK